MSVNVYFYERKREQQKARGKERRKYFLLELINITLYDIVGAQNERIRMEVIYDC